MLLRLATLALVASLAGCVTAPGIDDPDSAPSTAAPIAATDLDAALATALCQRWVRCGEADDLASCEAAAPGSSPAERAQRLVDVADGKVAYDAVAAGACLARITDAACTETQFASVDGALAACPAFVHGAQPDDTLCTHDAECASTFCEPDPLGPATGACRLGSCQPVPPALGSASGPAPAVGEACAVGAGPACAPGGYCAADATGPGHLCHAAQAPGATCRSNAECASGSCADDGRGGPAVCSGVTTCAY